MATHQDHSLAITTAVLSLISSLPLLPLIFLKRKNIALATLIGSIYVSTLIQFLNAVIWPNRKRPFTYLGQGLCDVEVKLTIGLGVAAPGALLCIYRQIAQVTDPARLGTRPSDKQNTWNKAFEITMCLGIPCLRMLLVYFVQPNRYWIVGVAGCQATVDASWPRYPLVATWPILIGCTTIVWAALATWRLARHLNEIIELLGNSSIANAKKAKLIKIYILTSVLFLIITPLNLYVFWINVETDIENGGLKAYSWIRIHPSNWASQIGQSSTQTQHIVSIFATISLTLITVIYFSFGRDSRDFYAKVWEKLARSMRKDATSIQSSPIDFLTPNHIPEVKVEGNEQPIFELPAW